MDSKLKRRKPRPRPKTSAELFDREAEVWKELCGTWRGLPPQALLRPGASGPEWSIKDVMAHISAWMQAGLRVLPELVAGRKATAGHGTDRFNAIHYEQDRSLSLTTIRRRLNADRGALLALIRALPEACVVDLGDRIGWWVKYTTYGHYGEHIRGLEGFRRKLLGTEGGTRKKS